MPIGLVSCTGLHSDQCDEFDLCPFVLVNKLLSASEVVKHRWYAIKSEISILALWPNADSEVRTPRVLRLSISLLSIVYRGCTANFISRLPSFLHPFPASFLRGSEDAPSINQCHRCEFVLQVALLSLMYGRSYDKARAVYSH